MTEQDQLRRARSAVARGDLEDVVELALGDSPASLHLIGDGLAAAVRAAVPGAGETARACRERLETRGWTGDDELRQVLEAAEGVGATPLLRPVPVDLDELSDVLEGDPVHGGGAVELATGAVWPRSAIDDAMEEGELEEDDLDSDAWLWVQCEGSRDGFRDMQLFLESVRAPDVARRLERALHGRGAFRRFRDVIWEHEDLLGDWLTFADDRRRGRARRWLAVHGCAPAYRAVHRAQDP
ncbi:UPF0158 family protein [Nocardioides marmoribigeumensis]|uniref:Uncharacterized protein n=1 Tax=Nocardioides marmoribigeumensis TaxID=433649 RepID=A0ABU2BR07_9ACTN|nr:UPF0158 family protein [Nocardioides marmoribigeumensis]MDR7361047.1 hypothetical protein [Nocardioides marmoribigeumensis]